MTIATRIIEIAKSERCHVPDSDDEPILFREPFSGRICLKVAIEDAFGLPDLPEDEVERCCSVNDWVALVGRVSG